MVKNTKHPENKMGKVETEVKEIVNSSNIYGNVKQTGSRIPTDSRNGNKIEGEASSAGGNERSNNHVITLVLPRWMYCYAPVITAVAAVVVAYIVTSYNHFSLESSLLMKTETSGWDAVDLFVNHDKNGDYYLSFEEAEPLLLQFVRHSQGKPAAMNPDIADGEDVVTIDAKFIPLNISTMTKDFIHDFSNNKSFEGLFKWIKPNLPLKDFGVSRFRELLPDNLDNIPVPGTVYTIVDGLLGLLGTTQLSSNRYFPPLAVGKPSVVHHLLSLFHSRPFVSMRFPPQGIFGCVRAVSETHVEVVFRMHSEFQLNEPPSLPFWFTPAQFTGSLTMARNGSIVEHFHLYVPADRQLNVDMEWLTEADKLESMEVDIGYMPQMELTSRGLSHPNSDTEESLQHEQSSQEIQWESEITMQEARTALEKKLFPFTQVTYYNLSEAFSLAQSQSKLVHSITLWGALDDQSC